MLDTTFPRVRGDVGNAATWPSFDVDFEVVRGVGVDDAVRTRDPRGYEQPFIAAARRLEQRGANLITTSCGFLILLQQRLRESVGVPVLASSLLQVPWAFSALDSSAKIGIMTFEKASLSDEHLGAAGIDSSRVAIAGLDGTPFHTTIREDLGTFDEARAREDHVRVAERLQADYPGIRTIVFECHNMPPYAAAVRDATGLPVFDVTTLIDWGAAAVAAPHRESRLSTSSSAR